MPTKGTAIDKRDVAAAVAAQPEARFSLVFRYVTRKDHAETRPATRKARPR